MPILVKIDGLSGHGDATLVGYADGDWFTAHSFGFGIQRQAKQPGRKGGTRSINVGVGELADVTISKSTDTVSPLLAQFAVNGNSGGGAQIDLVRLIEGEPTVSLRYRLDRCFVQRWSTSGDTDEQPSEEVALSFAKIAFVVAGAGQVFNWNRVKQKPWNGHGLDPLPVPPT